MYPKDTEKWKQFTTKKLKSSKDFLLFCIPKILKNESNSQLCVSISKIEVSCFVSQRYWKMKAIHNNTTRILFAASVVLYPKDTEKWKQFTTDVLYIFEVNKLFCIPKILKNESNSQPLNTTIGLTKCCFVSQRYWKMKAIHNNGLRLKLKCPVVLYPKDTEKWKQFTTKTYNFKNWKKLFCIPKILKNESNSQHPGEEIQDFFSCFVSQRYWKMKAIHNYSVC